MIRETITIGLLMFASSTFGQVCTPECDPTKAPTYYHIDNLGDFETKKAVVETWFRATGSPFAVHCSDGPAHLVFWGPSGHCSQPVPYDLTQFHRTRECVADAAVADVNGFKPTIDALRNVAPNYAPVMPDTPQRKIVQNTADRVTAVWSGGEVTYRQLGGAWFPDRGENRLTKWADGWSLLIAEDGSEETYSANGVLQKSISKDGRVTLFEFNERGLEVRRIESAGTPEQRFIWTEWDHKFRLPSRIAEPQRITAHTYNEHGRMLTVSTQITADLTGEAGFDAPTIGVPFLTTAFAYNVGGQVSHMRNGLNFTELAYDENNELGEIILTSAASSGYGGALFWTSSRYLLDYKRPKPPTVYPGICGSGINQLIIPDGVGGALNISFAEACTAHDACYGRCGADKDKCDQEIQVTILEQCKAEKFPPQPGGGNLYFDACMRWANAYRVMVGKFGAGPYREAQKNCVPGKCTP